MNPPPLRLRRIVDPKTGRIVLLSFTSGMELGVIPGMSDMPGAVGALTADGCVTGVVVHAGVLPSLFARRSDLACGTVVDLFGGTWMTSRPDRREQICSLEHAVRVGADAVLATVGMGGPDEARQLRLCGQISRDCKAWGMPFLIRIDTSQTDARRQYSATLSGYGARMAYELGADVVIVNYSDSPVTFTEAVRGVAIPVLIGGGPHMETDDALLESAAEAAGTGARGIALNAALFWQDGPTPTLAKLTNLFSTSVPKEGV